MSGPNRTPSVRKRPRELRVLQQGWDPALMPGPHLVGLGCASCLFLPAESQIEGAIEPTPLPNRHKPERNCDQASARSQRPELRRASVACHTSGVVNAL